MTQEDKRKALKQADENLQPCEGECGILTKIEYLQKMVELDQEEIHLRWIGDHDRAEIVREQKEKLKEWMSNG